MNQGIRRAVCIALLAFSLVGKAVAKPIQGLASWYGKQHQGKKMANGQRFDKSRLTAAHRKFKLGTILDVCFLRTGKCVQVEVTDRGPFKGKRMIDLSEAAAKAIGLRPYGVGRVSVEEVQ